MLLSLRFHEYPYHYAQGRLTQLIALTGPSGTWRKTLMDKAIAWDQFLLECAAYV